MQILSVEAENAHSLFLARHAEGSFTTLKKQPDFTFSSTLLSSLEGLHDDVISSDLKRYPVLDVLRNPELVLAEDEPFFQVLYVRTLVACLAGQLKAETLLALHKFQGSVIVEIPNGGTLTARIVEHILTENRIENVLRTIDKKQYIKPIKMLFKALMQGKSSDPWQAVEPMIAHFKDSDFPVARHYVIPEDTIENGDTMIIVMKGLLEHCHVHGAPTPRFTLMVPTIDVRHLQGHALESRIAAFAHEFNVEIEVLYNEPEDYTNNRVPEHGEAHAMLAQVLFGM